MYEIWQAKETKIGDYRIVLKRTGDRATYNLMYTIIDV